MELDNFSNVWECASGGGHMAEVLKNHGILAKASDKYDRGYGETIDFLEYSGTWAGDIITNPPYRFANQFIEKAMELLQISRKLALFLPIRYTEGKARKKLFAKYPPKKVWVSSGRIKCAVGGNFAAMKGSAVAYAWFIWEKGYTDESRLGWFN